MSVDFDDLAFALVDSQAETAVLWVLSRYSGADTHIKDGTQRDGYLHATGLINDQQVFLGRVVYWTDQQGHITVSPEPLMLPKGVQKIEFRIVVASQGKVDETTDAALRLIIQKNQGSQYIDVSADVVIFEGTKARPAGAVPPLPSESTIENFDEEAEKIADHLSPSRFLPIELAAGKTDAESIERSLFLTDPEGLETCDTLIAIAMPKVDHNEGEIKERSVFPARISNLSPSRIRDGWEEVRRNSERGLAPSVHPERPRLEIRTIEAGAQEVGFDWRGTFVSLTLVPMPESRLSDLEESVRATVVKRLVESAVQLDVQVQYAKRAFLGNLPQTTKGYLTRYGSGAYAKGRQIPFLCLWQGFLDALNQNETEASIKAAFDTSPDLEGAQYQVCEECATTWQKLEVAQKELGAACVPYQLNNLVYVRKLVELTRREMYENRGSFDGKFAQLTLWYANKAVEALSTDTIGMEFGPLAMGTFDLLRIERVDGLIHSERPRLIVFDPLHDCHDTLEPIPEPVFTMGIDGLYANLQTKLPDIRTSALLKQLVSGLIKPSQAHKTSLAESEELEKRKFDALGDIKPNEIITAGYIPKRLGGNLPNVFKAQRDISNISQALRHATDYSAIQGNIAERWQSIWQDDLDNQKRSPENPLRWVVAQAPGVNENAPADIPDENAVHRLEGLLSGDIDQKLLAYWAEKNFPFGILDAQADDAEKAIEVPVFETSETKVEVQLLDDITELFGEPGHSNKVHDIYGINFLTALANKAIVLDALAAFQKKDKDLIDAAFTAAKSANLQLSALISEVAKLRQEIKDATKQIAKRLSHLPIWIEEIDDLEGIVSSLAKAKIDVPVIAELVSNAAPKNAKKAKNAYLFAQRVLLADFGKTLDENDIRHWLLTINEVQSNQVQVATVAAMFEHLRKQGIDTASEPPTGIDESFVMASKILAAAAEQSGVTVSEDQANTVAAALRLHADGQSKTEFWSGLRNQAVLQ